MRRNLTLLAVGLGVFGLLAQSCSSGSSDGGGGTGGAAAGVTSDSGGRASTAGGSGGRARGVSGSAGSGAAPSSGDDGNVSGGGGTQAGGATSMSDAGAAGVGVADTPCIRSADCLPICQSYGWPEANCYGAVKQFCFCKSTTVDGPTCTAGTPEGCPPGTQCRGGKGCIPYGTGKDNDPCDNGDECAVDYTCLRYGNPLPNGNYSSCRHLCDDQHPLPADCYSCTSNIYCDPFPESAGGAPG